VNDIWATGSRITSRANREGQGLRIATFGAFVELGENIEALCHNTEIEERSVAMTPFAMHRTSTGPLKSAALRAGKNMSSKLSRSAGNRRIGLSYRAAAKQIERQEISTVRSTLSHLRRPPSAT